MGRDSVRLAAHINGVSPWVCALRSCREGFAQGFRTIAAITESRGRSAVLSCSVAASACRPGKSEQPPSEWVAGHALRYGWPDFLQDGSESQILQERSEGQRAPRMRPHSRPPSPLPRLRGPPPQKAPALQPCRPTGGRGRAWSPNAAPPARQTLLESSATKTRPRSRLGQTR
jgi:hypothetical protein